MTSVIANSRWLLSLACFLLLVSCDQRHSEPVTQRIIVLGFDGMDPGLAQRWMDDGSLPNFRKLAEQGSFQPLATSNPPQSPVAWSSFATGTKPGEHGVYDFLRRNPDTYGPEFSISEIQPPQHVLKLFGMALPLDSGSIENRRRGEAFWTRIENDGGATTILRVPVTYPPDPVQRMMSGMGVPDLLGTQGTYTLFTTRPLLADSTSSNTRAVRVRPDRSGRIEAVLEGPMHPLDQDPLPLTVPLAIEQSGVGVKVQLDGIEVDLAEGEWSDWVPLSFKYLKFAGIPGMVRLHLVSGYPRIRLYVSPIHIDPRKPVVPLSSPPDYSARLAAEIGLYHTIGMPEETWSLNEGHIDDAAFLDMVRTTLKEREAMFYNALDKQDSHVVTGVFVQTDRVSHMFFRGLDDQHPLHAETNQQSRKAIHWIYREADRILGETMQRMMPGDQLLVISDHGFAPFRWAVHLNRWLLENGYLVLKEGKNRSAGGFADVDWKRTKAYALGLNGLYINRRGREAQGWVGNQKAAEFKLSLRNELGGWDHQETGLPVVRQVFDGDDIYPGNANGDAPDLVVGYEPGFRASWQTTLGSVPGLLTEPNKRKWSGDHCIAPEAVPGVLFTSFKLDQAMPAISDIAGFLKQHWNDAVHEQ